MVAIERNEPLFGDTLISKVFETQLSPKSTSAFLEYIEKEGTR